MLYAPKGFEAPPLVECVRHPRHAHHVPFVADVTAGEVIGDALELLEEYRQEQPAGHSPSWAG